MNHFNFRGVFIIFSCIGKQNKGEFVSMIKTKIIQQSIKSLQAEGLRFSIDLLAKELKISKKTIYKYFKNKEALAMAIYEKFYLDTKKKITQILKNKPKNYLFELLSLYLQSFDMIKDEIFNKYKLNDSIQSYALMQHSQLWEMIEKIFPRDYQKSSQIIIDGSLEKLSYRLTRIAVNTMTTIDASLAAIISGTIVSAAIINEIIAVLLAKTAFKWAGEISQQSSKK